MSEREPSISLRIEPGARLIEVAAGTRVSSALKEAGLDFAFPCGERGLCGKCRVEFEEGAPEPTEEERKFLSPAERDGGVRLACCAAPVRNAVVRAPEQREMRTEHVLDAGVKSDIVVEPEVVRTRVDLPPSTLKEPVSDWERVRRGLPEDLPGPPEPALEVLRDLPAVVSRAESQGEPVTATLDGCRVIDVRCGDASGECFGVAVDLGTTTIAAVLVDLRTGEKVASAGRRNPQQAFGFDVISRIHAVQMERGNLEKLHRLAVEAIADLIVGLCKKRNIDAATLAAMTLAGNTAMSHLFLGIDPTGLGQAPFAGALSAGVRVEARELGLPLHPRASVYVFPCIGGFIGGDIVAGILLTKLRRQSGVSVLVDIGTNGEVVVSHGGRLFATSSAAGPAFEGGKIRCGGMAVDGAINHVLFDGADFEFSTISDAPASCICGSGLIEIFGRFLETGVLGMNGRIPLPGGSEARTLPPALAVRLGSDDSGPSIALTPAGDGRAATVITQADVREFQLGKGAVQAAIAMVLEETGIPLSEIDRFLVAGAFGTHLNVADAMRVGLLPDLPREKVHFIGNSALEGARCALINRYEKIRAEQIAQETQFVELASRPEFQERFAMSMMLGPAME
ncbi:MAG TPA: ASKHA domain-containing protein [Sumerlaeia bacterium]|nr:ASKHA domain-containing protein [Sumerlaeia bacterium]